MDIFITEPLVDWEKLARRLQVQQEGDGTSSWFPEQKLRIVARKLERDNPADIMIDELRSSVHGRSPALKNLEQIVGGVAGSNVRTEHRGTCATVADQVACLVDLATDPNILGRMYGGWAAWV
jgi:DNA-dependent protein kinase catalytic subunit